MYKFSLTNAPTSCKAFTSPESSGCNCAAICIPFVVADNHKSSSNPSKPTLSPTAIIHCCATEGIDILNNSEGISFKERGSFVKGNGKPAIMFFSTHFFPAGLSLKTNDKGKVIPSPNDGK